MNRASPPLAIARTGSAPCYAEGYARGKDKAHFEALARADGQPHGSGCGCDPCQTVRGVIAALVREAAHAGLTGCGLTGGPFCGSNEQGDRCPGWPEGQERGNPSGDCPLRPTGCILADVADYIESAVAPTGSLAVLEADSLARQVRRGLASQGLAGLQGRADADSLATFMAGMAGPGRRTVADGTG